MKNFLKMKPYIPFGSIIYERGEDDERNGKI